MRSAMEAIVCQHLSVGRVAEGLGVSWYTANNAVLAEGQRVLTEDPARFDGVRVIGVDEHVWRHTRREDSPCRNGRLRTLTDREDVTFAWVHLYNTTTLMHRLNRRPRQKPRPSTTLTPDRAAHRSHNEMCTKFGMLQCHRPQFVGMDR